MPKCMCLYSQKAFIMHSETEGLVIVACKLKSNRVTLISLPEKRELRLY